MNDKIVKIKFLRHTSAIDSVNIDLFKYSNLVSLLFSQLIRKSKNGQLEISNIKIKIKITKIIGDPFFRYNLEEIFTRKELELFLDNINIEDFTYASGTVKYLDNSSQMFGFTAH